MNFDTEDLKRHALLYFTLAVWASLMFGGVALIDHVFFHWQWYEHRHLETDPTSVHFAKIVGTESAHQLALAFRIFWAVVIGGILMPGATFLAGSLLVEEWLPARQRQQLYKKEERERQRREAKDDDLSQRERELALLAAEANVYEHLADNEVELRDDTKDLLKRVSKHDALTRWNVGKGDR